MSRTASTRPLRRPSSLLSWRADQRARERANRPWWHGAQSRDFDAVIANTFGLVVGLRSVAPGPSRHRKRMDQGLCHPTACTATIESPRHRSQGSGVMTVAHLPGHAGSHPGATSLPVAAAHVRAPLEWFAGGAVLSFAVPWIAADVLELHHDLYLLVYVTVLGTFLASFMAHAWTQVRKMLATNLWWSIGVGAVVGLALMQNVMREESTTRPSGAFYVFEIAWRGIVYGAFDALLLFVFPAAVAYLLMAGNREGFKRKLSFASLTVALSVLITAVYHLGYEQFRGGELIKPEIGAAFGNVPAVLTGNPLGAVLAHAAFHVTSNVHAYRSGTFLPPDLNGYAERGGGGTGLAIAVAWIALTACLVWWQRRRLFPAGER
jgi:hypothetical protein